jgi:P27 family predicted phage terminase small subunit
MKSAPKTLDPAARAKFREVARLLADRGGDALDNATVDLVTLYAAAFTRWSQAEAEIAKTGAVVRSQVGAAVQNPWLAVSQAALRQVVRLAGELKISPKSRTRKPAAEPEPDGLSQLLKLRPHLDDAATA